VTSPRPQVSNATARRLFQLVEPIAVVTYLAPEPTEAVMALGAGTMWDAYSRPDRGADHELRARFGTVRTYANGADYESGLLHRFSRLRARTRSSANRDLTQDPLMSQVRSARRAATPAGDGELGQQRRNSRNTFGLRPLRPKPLIA
jgi:hypothetical protein